MDKITFATDRESQVVTGHLVNVKPNIKKNERRNLRAVMYKCRILGPEKVAEDSIVKLRNSLRGNIAHFQSVDPVLGAKFLEDFNSIQWPTQL